MTPAAKLLSALSRVERCVFEGLEPEAAVQRIAVLTGVDPVRLWRMLERKQRAREAAQAALSKEPRAKPGAQARHRLEISQGDSDDA